MKPTRNISTPLPMSRDEMAQRGWKCLDVLLISGDAYVDHPSFGIAVIGRTLEAAGYRVGIISQPDWNDPTSVEILGRPRLFAGISSGNLDSMLAHYTPSRHIRDEDSYTENGEAGRRPNRALTVYSQLVRRAFKGLPVVIGGLEASMRRIAHYDFWQDKIRPSVLTDSKADLLVYGMGEAPIIEVARRLDAGNTDLSGICSTARLLKGKESEQFDRTAGALTGYCQAGKPGSQSDAAGAAEKQPVAGEGTGGPNSPRPSILPSFEEMTETKAAIREATKIVEREANPDHAKPLIQFHGARALLVEPPSPTMTTEEMDRIYALPFTRRPHPKYTGKIPAWEMIRDSVTVVRGCPGGCSFCSLGMHQGKFLTSRSRDSVVAEVQRIAEQPEFKGTISDLGGPTANLYGCHNGEDEACKTCRRPSCLWPSICPRFEVDGARGLDLLRAVRNLPEVKHLFINSGLRMEVLLRTPEYFKELVRHHVSGHLKVAPEHLESETLRRMRKCSADVFHEFRNRFDAESKSAGKEQYIVPYFISAFPGCTPKEMAVVERFVTDQRWRLQQVQDFIPLPMTPAAAMYWSELDYDTGNPISVPKGTGARKAQREQLQPHSKGPGKTDRRDRHPRKRRR